MSKTSLKAKILLSLLARLCKYGSGNYRTYNEFNNEFFRGDGSMVYNGGGIAARYENKNGVYAATLIYTASSSTPTPKATALKLLMTSLSLTALTATACVLAHALPAIRKISSALIMAWLMNTNLTATLI